MIHLRPEPVTGGWGGRPALRPLSVVRAAPTTLSHSRGTKPRGLPKWLHYCQCRGHSYTVSHRLSLGSEGGGIRAPGSSWYQGGVCG